MARMIVFFGLQFLILAGVWFVVTGIISLLCRKPVLEGWRTQWLFFTRKRLHLFNVALGLAGAAVVVNWASAPYHMPTDERGWMWFPEWKYIMMSLGPLLLLVDVCLWMFLGAWAIARMGADFQDW